MPRIMTPAMAAAFCAPVLRPALLVALNFATGPVYVWNGSGTLTWNGMSFTGVGALGSISTISEDSTVEAKGITLELSGIPSDLLTDVLEATRVLGRVQIWLALFDANNNIIADPILAWQGGLDKPTTKDSGETCTVSINCENVLVDLNRACYRRYTDADQQLDLADTLTRLSLPANTVDTGFTHVPGIQEASIFWGTTPHSSNNT